MLVAQMSTYPRAIATHCCSWGSTKFKLTHGALTAFEDLGVQPRRPCSPWTLRLTTFVVVISSWDLMVTSTGSRACESKPHKVGNVRASEHSGDDSPAWGSCEFPGGVNSPPRVLPSTNNGLVSTRGARRALLPHLIAHSGRPRGGANRAGERAPRSRSTIARGGGSGSTEIWPLTNFWSGSIDIGLRT